MDRDALEIKLDATDRRLLDLLYSDARLSYAELGRRVGLTAPAVTERMRRMEEGGVILGYRAVIRLPQSSPPVTVFVQCIVPAERYPSFLRLVESLPAVRECHHVTGEISFVLKIVIGALQELDPILARLGSYGQTRTSVVLSSPVER